MSYYRSDSFRKFCNLIFMLCFKSNHFVFAMKSYRQGERLFMALSAEKRDRETQSKNIEDNRRSPCYAGAFVKYHGELNRSCISDAEILLFYFLCSARLPDILIIRRDIIHYLTSIPW